MTDWAVQSVFFVKILPKNYPKLSENCPKTEKGQNRSSVLMLIYDDLTGGFGTLNYCSYICEQKQA